jgi:Polyketide cyclase / dehydrase and lipid transport
MAELVVAVEVDAPGRRVWPALVDWDHQGEWMLGTRVRAMQGDGHRIGAGIEARTGLGPFPLIRDTMVIIGWDPPHRCMVRHTGRLLRGMGAFEVVELPGGRSRVVWSEWFTPPLGRAGVLAWYVVRPLARWSCQRSLHEFAARMGDAASRG